MRKKLLLGIVSLRVVSAAPGLRIVAA